MGVFSVFKKDKDFLEIESEVTGETSYLEEDVYVPEEIVKNKSLIRMDMNIVQFPIFSKNAKRKKNEVTTYYFNKNRDTFIIVKPPQGELIPGEGEEKIFIALMKIMKDKGMQQEFYVTAGEIKDAAKMTSNSYITDIKKALFRLSDTIYYFKNTLYSNELTTIIKEKINTPILTFSSLSLTDTKNSDLKKRVNDKRVKEVFCIKISDHFYRNIVKRGYLVYDSEILLGIHSGVARTLYMLLEKIRFENLYVKESIFALIKKIPLKYEKKSLPTTIKTLEKSFNELKQKDLIKDFKFIKETTWLEADVEVFFSENHNSLKQERFEEDNNELKNIYNTLAISYTEKNIEAETPTSIVTKEMVEEIVNILPKKAQGLKSIPKTVFDSIQKYGYEKVKAAAIYLKNQKNLTSPRAYFLKTLENNWAADIVIEELKVKAKASTEESKPIYSIPEENVKNYDKAEKYFNSLSLEEKKEIENKSYIEYIQKCGQETKIQKLAFERGKNKIIYEYIDTYSLYSNNKFEHIAEAEVIHNEPEPRLEESSKANSILTDIVKFNQYIDESIMIYEIGLNLSKEKVFEIKKNILLELTGKFILKELSLDEINKSIAKNLK